MSTKTTFKRIALVAVAALGLGVVSTVAPASAATNFRASYTAPTAYDTQVGLVGTGATVANIGTIQLDLATLDSSLAAGTDSTTVTVTANDGAVAKDVTLASALTMSMTVSGTTTVTTAYNAATGYNALNNGTVTVSGLAATLTGAAANYATASGKVYLNVARASLASTDTGAKVKLTQTVSSGGVISTYVSTITLTIGSKAGTATIVPATAVGTITAGGSATATITQPYTNTPAASTWVDNTFTLAGTAAGSTFNVTAVATGGSVSLVRTSASVITATATKDALTGAFSVVYTITVNAAATAAAGETVTAGGFTWTVQPYTPAYSYSTASIVAGSNGYYAAASAGGDGIVWGLASDKTNSSATVTIVQKDQLAAPISAVAYAKTVSASITGKGSLSAIASTADVVVKSKTWSVANGQLTNGTSTIDIYSDGTSGEGTLTITVDGATAKTYTVRFLGDAATITATMKRPIGSTSSAANGSAGTTQTTVTNAIGGTTKTVDTDTAPAIAVIVKDSNGWAIPTSTAPLAAISDVTVVQSVARQFIDAGISDVVNLRLSAGTFVQHYLYTTNTNTSGKTSTVTFSYVNGAGTLLSATPVTVTLGGAAVKTAITFDKATYFPGEAAIITFTGTDSAGNKAYDGQNIIAGGIESTLDFGGANTVTASAWTTATIVDGKKVRYTYAPVTKGAWTVTGYTAAGASFDGKAVVEVDNSVAEAAADAAAEATDAANAATDAANAAAEAADAATAAAQDAADAVAALSTQVSEMIDALKKQITALTNLVIKIQKKVKA
jgi:hypothetical protein